MFAAATSFFARTNISQNYNIGSAPGAAGGSRASTPGPPGSAGPAAVPTFRVGPWRVQAATHKSTLKRVSVWDLDKRSQWMERLNPAARDRALEVLKAEVRGVRTSLSLRELTEEACRRLRWGDSATPVFWVSLLIPLNTCMVNIRTQRWWNRWKRHEGN